MGGADSITNLELGNKGNKQNKHTEKEIENTSSNLGRNIQSIQGKAKSSLKTKQSTGLDLANSCSKNLPQLKEEFRQMYNKSCAMNNEPELEHVDELEDPDLEPMVFEEDLLVESIEEPMESLEEAMPTIPTEEADQNDEMEEEKNDKEEKTEKKKDVISSQLCL